MTCMWSRPIREKEKILYESCVLCVFLEIVCLLFSHCAFNFLWDGKSKKFFSVVNTRQQRQSRPTVKYGVMYTVKLIDYIDWCIYSVCLSSATVGGLLARTHFHRLNNRLGDMSSIAASCWVPADRSRRRPHVHFISFFFFGLVVVWYSPHVRHFSAHVVY